MQKDEYDPFGLDLGPAAVNEQFDTRDETEVIRRPKQRYLGNFLRFPQPLMKSLRRLLTEVLLVRA